MLSRVSPRALVLLFALMQPGCDKALGQAHAVSAHPPTPASGSAAGTEHASAPSALAHGAESGAAQYGVPFAWEQSGDEPLAKARAFLGEAVADNDKNVARGRRGFAPFVDKQSPRATVLTCSDSRVQSEAWDASPENDDFVIRNIGNQLANAEGSVAYGLEHLHTPVLLVIGHTGCGAVKAALGSREGLEPSIQKELEALQLAAPPKGTSEDEAWEQAVIANVNAQVVLALQKFGALVGRGDLTVVGAVYDFRNDLGKGSGRLVFVNVNGNTDERRIQAFVGAVTEKPGSVAPKGTLPVSPGLRALMAEQGVEHDDFAGDAESSHASDDGH